MAFAKLKALIRRAAARTYENLWCATGHRTSACSRSVATSDFFVRVPKLAQKSPDGCGVRDNAGRCFQGSSKFRQGDVTVLHHQFFKKRSMRCKLAATEGATLDIRRDRTSIAQLSLPTHPRRGRKLQSGGCSASA